MTKCYTCLQPLPMCDCDNTDKVIRLKNLLNSGFKSAWQTIPIVNAIKTNEDLLNEIKKELEIDE